MKISSQQITPRGIAQQSGLDIFSSIITFDGEFMNWGYFFAYGTQLNSDSDYETSDDKPAVDAITNQPPLLLNTWYRYHTNTGGVWVDADAPSIEGGIVSFNGIKTDASTTSESGMYSKLSGLTVGKEYEISVQTVINSNTGVLYVNTYSQQGSTVNLNTSYSVSSPIGRSSIGIQKFTFTAVTQNDIIALYFNPTAIAAGNITFTISNISIKEQQEYIVPIYAEDIFGNAHQVLRLNVNNTVLNA